MLSRQRINDRYFELLHVYSTAFNTPATPHERSPNSASSAATRVDTQPSLAYSDFRATGNYLALQDSRWLTNIVATPDATAIAVSVADSNIIKCTHRGILHVPSVVDMPAYIFPGLN